jgi:uncharacterized phiE125 gp8 family phage protein
MITLQQIKFALKIDYSTDDQELLRIRDAALAWVHTYTGLYLEPQEITLYGANFNNALPINALPFDSISSVKYTDTDNVLTTMPSTDYFIDKTQGDIYYLRFLERPFQYEGTLVEVKVLCGYPVLPKDVQQAVISLIGAWYNNPEAVNPVSLTPVPLGCQMLLEGLRVRSLLR